MRVFVWNEDFLTDYTSGIGVVVADTVEQARELGRKQRDTADWEKEPQVIELDQPKVIAVEYGGS